MDLREQYIARRIDNWIFVAKNDGEGSPSGHRGEIV